MMVSGTVLGKLKFWTATLIVCHWRGKLLGVNEFKYTCNYGIGQLNNTTREIRQHTQDRERD